MTPDERLTPGQEHLRTTVEPPVLPDRTAPELQRYSFEETHLPLTPQAYPREGLPFETVTENLSEYRNHFLLADGREMPGIEFDIERTFSWDQQYQLGEVSYAAMVNVYFPLELQGHLPAGRIFQREDLRELMKRVEGFRPAGDQPDGSFQYLGFQNDTEGIVVNWSIRAGHPCLGIVQNHSSSTLEDVIERTLPIIERLSQTILSNPILSDTVIDRSIDYARQAAADLPIVLPPLIERPHYADQLRFEMSLISKAYFDLADRSGRPEGVSYGYRDALDHCQAALNSYLDLEIDSLEAFQQSREHLQRGIEALRGHTNSHNPPLNSRVNMLLRLDRKLEVETLHHEAERKLSGEESF
jgi:hypothetical protein